MPSKVIGEGVPSIESQTEADTKADADMDNALDKIIGQEDSAPSQDETSTPTEGRTQDDKDTKTTSVDSDTGEPAEAPNSKGAQTKEYRQALQSLRLDKVPQKVLDSLDPDELIAWGNERAKNHLDVDRIKFRNSELERAKTIVKDDPEHSDSDANIDEIMATVENDFGEEMSTPLKAFGEAIIKKVTEGNAARESQLDALFNQIQVRERNEAREALSERWNLSDERWQQVLDYVDADQNGHPNTHKAIESGCLQLFAKEAMAEFDSKLATEHVKRSKGQPTTEHRTSPASVKDMPDLEDKLLDDIIDGKTEAIEKTSREIGRRNRGGGVPAAGKIGITS